MYTVALKLNAECTRVVSSSTDLIGARGRGGTSDGSRPAIRIHFSELPEPQIVPKWSLLGARLNEQLKMNQPKLQKRVMVLLSCSRKRRTCPLVIGGLGSPNPLAPNGVDLRTSEMGAAGAVVGRRRPPCNCSDREGCHRAETTEKEVADR